MRKSLIVIAVLLVLSLGVIVSAAVIMDGQHENITITEQRLYGDPAAAEGLIVTSRVHSSNHLLFDTVYEAGADPQPETVFSYSNERQYAPGENEGWFSLSLASVNFGFSGHVDLETLRDPDNESREWLYELTLPLLDVAERASAGEEYTERVVLTDYYTYFPIKIEYSLINDAIRYRENAVSLHKYFNERFRIPIPEDMEIDVTVSKDMDGNIYDLEMYEANGKMVAGTQMWPSAVVLENGVCFGLFGDVDFSQVEGGYGLYWIPVRVEEGGSFATGTSWGTREDRAYLREECVNIYPMDPADCEMGELHLSEDGSRIYALTKESGQFRMTVFDAETQEILQQLEPGMTEMPTLWQNEELVLLLSSDPESDDWRLQVYLLQDGLLELWLDTEMYRGEWENPPWYMGTELCFDGEKLAISQYWDNWNKSSHRILIYDQSGLLYAADYLHNGDTLPEPLELWNWSGPLLEWKS